MHHPRSDMEVDQDEGVMLITGVEGDSADMGRFADAPWRSEVRRGIGIELGRMQTMMCSSCLPIPYQYPTRLVWYGRFEDLVMPDR